MNEIRLQQSINISLKWMKSGFKSLFYLIIGFTSHCMSTGEVERVSVENTCNWLELWRNINTELHLYSCTSSILLSRIIRWSDHVLLVTSYQDIQYRDESPVLSPESDELSVRRKAGECTPRPRLSWDVIS